MENDRDLLSALLPQLAAQLRGAMGNLHLAAAQLIPPEAREKDPALDAKAALLDQSYYRILHLVDHLTAVANLEAHRPPALQNRDMVELVRNICDKAGALARHLHLEVHFVCALYRRVCAVDPPAMEQLIYQLLSNAFKFTPAGGTITVELQAQKGHLLLSVADTGCGISPEHLETLFDRCFQPNRTDPPPHGLGLGLGLCRRIAEAHGGTLVAESQPGMGSRFTLSIPDRQVPGSLSDVAFDYAGGFNRTLLALADALPPAAFLLRSQE